MNVAIWPASFWVTWITILLCVVAAMMVAAFIWEWWQYTADKAAAKAYLRNVIIAVAVAVIFAVFLGVIKTHAQEHQGHPKQDQQIHERFYSTWMMPDAPRVSCCSNEDCFPAQSKREGGDWYARKNDDEEWVKIPASKIEQNRDTPDGRSHLCGRRWSGNGDFTVFCFILGAGG